MLDASLSQMKDLQVETEAAARFIAQVVRPKRPRRDLRIFRRDHAVDFLSLTMCRACRRPCGELAPAMAPPLYDAVYLGSQALEKGTGDRRRVLVLLTDAGETTSRADFETARRAAVRAGALLYTIVIRAVAGENGRNTAGEHALETIADTTGGAMYYPDDISQLKEMFDRIDRELRTQYRLGYYPQPRPPQGLYRSIEVRVKGDYKVRSQKSYYSGGVAE